MTAQLEYILEYPGTGTKLPDHILAISDHPIDINEEPTTVQEGTGQGHRDQPYRAISPTISYNKHDAVCLLSSTPTETGFLKTMKPNG